MNYWHGEKRNHVCRGDEIDRTHPCRCELKRDHTAAEHREVINLLLPESPISTTGEVR